MLRSISLRSARQFPLCPFYRKIEGEINEKGGNPPFSRLINYDYIFEGSVASATNDFSTCALIALKVFVGQFF